MSIYINLDNSADGSGSSINPYNSFISAGLNTGGGTPISGDQSGQIFYVKGSTRTGILIASASNFRLQNWIDTLPVITASDILTGMWAQEGSDWYLDYSIAAGKRNRNDSLYANGVQLIAVSLKASLAENTQWFDSTNDRMYVRLDGTNPNSVQFEATNLDACIDLTGSGAIIDGMQAKHGYNNNIDMTTVVDGSIVRNCNSTYAGGWGSASGHDGIVVYGDSTTPAIDIAIYDNDCRHNQNNGVEIWGINGLAIENNEIHSNGSGVECWGYITNADIKYNKISKSKALGTLNFSGRGIWVTGTDAGANTGNQGNITVEANVIYRTYKHGIDLGDGSGHTIWNNTIYLHADDTLTANGMSCVRVKTAGAAAIAVDISNNILSGHRGNGIIPFYQYDATGSIITGDKNHHWGQLAGQFEGYWLATRYTSLSTFQTASAPELAADTFGDPLFTDEANDDFTLATGSPCLDTGDLTARTPAWSAGSPVPVDVRKELFRASGGNKGCYETISPFAPSQLML